MIHPSSVVDSPVPDDAEIGPFAVLGKDVTLGSGIRIGAHATVMGPTVLGDGVVIGPSAVVGTDPQDLKYGGERTSLTIGPRTVVREFANINRSTSETEPTTIGSDCLIMAYVHVAHDCRIGDRVILANAVNIAGHVDIGDDVTIGGVVPVHQFVRIGAHSMIGGGYRVNKDVHPFILAGGYPLHVAALNAIGMRRKGFAGQRLEDLDRAFRYLFREDGNLTVKAGKLLETPGCSPDVTELARFILSSERGVIS